MLPFRAFSTRAHLSLISRHNSSLSTSNLIKDAVFVPQLGTSFPYRWLRDSCQCSQCVHPTNKQKLGRTSDVALYPIPLKTEFDSNRLRIQWQTVNGQAHQSDYSLSWLKSYASPKERKTFHKDLDRISWNKADLVSDQKLFISYCSILKSKQDLHLALSQLIRYGLVFLTGVPTDKTDDTNCEVRKLGGLLGRIRDTFYGEVWDVVSLRNSTNIAYTNLDLGLHMDLLYFQHPPRYQILHCLRNKVVGGSSYFVDAIRIAETLRAENKKFFDLLTRIPVPYHYINDGHHLHNTHPVIQLSQTDNSRVEYINYSPPFQAPLLIETPPEFYHALKRFSELLDSEADTYRHTLREGEVVIFDNRRVLHARTEFHEKEDVLGDEPSRWLKGCYLEADDILDRQRILAH